MIPLLSLTGKRWIFPQKKHEGDIAEVLAKARAIDLSQKFSWNALCDPLSLGDMHEAVERIQKALEKKETVGLIGDYDADGITGTAQLIRYFRRHGSNPVVILPHRQKHGYGVKREFIDHLHAQGASLLITVDTGISHAAELGYARERDIEVIVTDHHSVPKELPDALLVHPTAKKTHTNPHLSGAGVAFTLIRALEKGNWEERDIDVALASIGTVADVVPLLGENRTIVQLGLEAMMKGKDAPIFDFAHSICKENERLTSTHIGFRIAPRINAAGRLADPSLSLHALLEGGNALEEIQVLNERRREETQKMIDIAEEMVDPNQPILMIQSHAFHPGIVGLVAGKLAERYGRPSLVGSERSGQITCSLRSIPEYHIAEALRRTERHLISCGGHAAAAGCTLRSENWDAFQEAFIADAHEALADCELMPSVTIDAVLEDPPTIHDVHALEKLEPFGQGNPEPRFLLKNQELTLARCVGADGNHLACRLGRIKAIGFGLGPLLPKLPERVDIVCRLGIDAWQGYERVQVFIEDIRVKTPATSSLLV